MFIGNTEKNNIKDLKFFSISHKIYNSSYRSHSGEEKWR